MGGVTRAGRDLPHLGPGSHCYRIGIAGPGRNPGRSPPSLADALAVITGALLAVDDPVYGPAAPNPSPAPTCLASSAARRHPRPSSRRFEPRNVAFTNRPDEWQLRDLPAPGHRVDDPATAEDGGRWPRPCPSRPDSPSSPRKSTPATTAAAPSPSAPTAPRPGARPRRAGRPEREPAQATPGSQTRSLGRPGRPRCLRHRNRHVDPVRGHRPGPGGRQSDQVRVFLNGGGQVELRHPRTSASSARPAITPSNQDSPSGAGVLADRGAHPIVSAAGVKGGEKLCRAVPVAIPRMADRGRGGHLTRFRVERTMPHEGRTRASPGQDLMSPVLLRSEPPRASTARTPPRAPFAMENSSLTRPARKGRHALRQPQWPPASSTRELSEPSATLLGLPLTTTALAQAFLRDTPAVTPACARHDGSYRSWPGPPILALIPRPSRSRTSCGDSSTTCGLAGSPAQDDDPQTVSSRAGLSFDRDPSGTRSAVGPDCRSLEPGPGPPREPVWNLLPAGRQDDLVRAHGGGSPRAPP